MRRLAACAMMIALLAGCGGGEQYNTAPSVQVEPQGKAKKPRKPKKILSQSSNMKIP